MGPFYRTSYQTKQQEPIDVEARVLSPKGSLVSPNLTHGSSSRRRRSHSRRATKCIVAGIVLCLLAYFFHVSSRVKALRSQRLLHERQPIDVVAVSLKPSCVTRQAIASLNRHLQPRTIHIITTSRANCDVFATFAPNVACHLQDEFLPGLSAKRVGDLLQHRLGLDQHTHFKGRELAGWYMQQLIKLGSVLAIPTLSEYYLIWDLDMVLLAPVQLLWPSPGPPDGGAGGAASSASGGTAAAATGSQIQTLVNIGGSVSPGYVASFQHLFKRSLEFAPDGTSFVTHWMVIYKPFLLEFLKELAAGGGGGGGDGDGDDGDGGRPVDEVMPELDWAWRILGAVDSATANLGFSEYASYISWVRQRYPQSQRLAPRKTWVRHPLGQGTVKMMRLMRADRCCCPSGLLLRLVRALGFVYTGYEVGHIAECRYDAPEHAASYGLGRAAG